MTILEWLLPSMKKLARAGVDSPRRDCLVLLEDLLKKDRSWVNAHAEFALSSAQTIKLDKQIKRRMAREPLAFIRGKAWFYDRFFNVSQDVIVPRPESESFIELLKQSVAARQLPVDSTIVDIGTGSGCLAITAKLELPKTQIIATDISEKALKVAQKNAKNHNVDIKFVQGSLLEPLSAANRNLSVIIANLPYVPDGLVTSEEINYEPAGALFSGKDGLDHYREFYRQVKALRDKPQYILSESLENQHEHIRHLAQKSGYKLEKTEVLVQLFKLA